MTIIDFLINILAIRDDKLLLQLSNIGKILTYPKKGMLFRMYEKPEYLAFLSRGIIRGYFSDESGHETTDCFVFEAGAPIVPSYPFYSPALMNMEAVVDCEVIAFPTFYVVDFIRCNPCLVQIYNQLLGESMKVHFKHKNALRMRTKERYQWFLQEYPSLSSRVQDNHIASFLSMSEENLNRIKKFM
ncbi:Crp/Fnr family transcriptional regulator [Solibaculum mannosilyticum]|uniref:Crp/Fnr family transcriptional regulator n=1 Tax=Solibaculum mannosilyticum TaxID=2780922 RepID=UPI0034C4E930